MDEFGDDWKGCYVEFRDPSVEEIQRLQSAKDDKEDFKRTTDHLKKWIVGGKGFDGKGKTDITKDNVLQLPISVLKKCVSFLVRSV